MSNGAYSRRKFIHKYLVAGTALFGGGLFFGGCNSKSSEKNEDEAIASNLKSCSDLSGVSESEIQKRKSFGYTEESPIPDNKCGNCSLYIPPEGNKKCGECMLFKGPVYASAYCTYWAPLT
jgi:hypothetical protein